MGVLENYASKEQPPRLLAGDTGVSPRVRIKERADGYDVQAPVEGSTTDDLLVAAGMDPQHFQVDTTRGVRVSTWQVPYRDKETGELLHREQRAMRAYVVPRLQAPYDITDLIEEASKVVEVRDYESAGGTFIFATGDWQLGKCESDPVGTLNRLRVAFAHGLADASRFKASSLVIALTGDCVEGVVSQGGKNVARTTLTLTEQLQMHRRAVLSLVKSAVMAGFPSVQVWACEANHGDVSRAYNSKFNDNFDIDSVIAVSDALELSPEVYGRVKVVVPGEDEWGVVQEVEGLAVALQHGHQHRPGKQWQWWDGHAGSGTAYGRASVLLEGHLHHYHADTRGHRTFIGVPSMEERSQWWVRKTGITGRPGAAGVFIAEGKLKRFYEIPVELPVPEG